MTANRMGLDHTSPPWTRRTLLKVGSLGFLGLSLSKYLRLQHALAGSAQRAEPKAQSVILLWLNGGYPAPLQGYSIRPRARLPPSTGSVRQSTRIALACPAKVVNNFCPFTVH